MKIVLLAGGKGKRLWPASTDEIPKQFLKVHGDDTMIEKTFNNLCDLYDKSDIYIATTREYKSYLEELLPEFNNYIIEPKAHGTYTAVLNIGAYLKYEEKVSDKEIVSILPIDSNVDKEFFKVFKEGEKKLKKSSSICLIGIKPSSVNCGYGYIVHDEDKVICFSEKPNYDDAIDLINKGALWNSGIFIANVYKLMTLVSIYEVSNYKEFIYKYLDIPKGSFDKRVLEKEKDLFVITSDYDWCDIGVWENLSPYISDSDVYNSNIINYEDKKIINDGVKDVIVINSKNGIKLLNKRKDNVCIKRWGSYEVLNDYIGTCSVKMKKLNINAGKNISYQYHNHRNEEWVILSGTGVVIIDGVIRKVKAGDKVSIKALEKHIIKATTNMEVIETQYGDLCVEDDIVRLEDNFSELFNRLVEEV